METDKESSRTIRRKSRDTVKKKISKADLNSSTMQIPVEAVFNNLPQTHHAYLDVSCPGMDPVRVALSKNKVIIGRDKACKVSLPLSNVSRNHAYISGSGDEYILQDLDSTNGTFVNNVRVSKCILRNNDIVRIGESLIKFIENKK